MKFGSSQELVEDSVDSTDAADKALSPYVGHRRNAQTKALFDSIRHTPVPDNELIDQYLAASKRDVTWYNRNFQRNLVKINTGHFSSEEFMHKLQKTISTLMFFLMPLFALFLWLLFRRSRMYYTEHLVFSIHIHCIVFLVLTLYMLLSSLFSVSLWWPFLITLVYGWLCARNVSWDGVGQNHKQGVECRFPLFRCVAGRRDFWNSNQLYLVFASVVIYQLYLLINYLVCIYFAEINLFFACGRPYFLAQKVSKNMNGKNSFARP